MSLPPEWPASIQPLWDSYGIQHAFDASKAVLQVTRPPCVMLHATYENLLRDGARVGDQVRALLGPETAVWWGITGDWHYSDVEHGRMSVAQIQALRLQTLGAAVAAGVPQVEWNCEAAWKHKTGGFDATAAREMIAEGRALYPTLGQSLTTYAQPRLHSTFAWKGFLDVDWYGPQIYWIGRNVVNTYNAHRDAWALAVKLGWVSNAPVQPYLYAHSVKCADTTWCADHFSTQQWWITPGYIDGQGETAMQCEVALRAAGFSGPGRVSRYQRAHPPLVVDGKVGPQTCASLGVVWKP